MLSFNNLTQHALRLLPQKISSSILLIRNNKMSFSDPILALLLFFLKTVFELLSVINNHPPADGKCDHSISQCHTAIECKREEVLFSI